MDQPYTTNRGPACAGIAIGPILLVIALLAVLATAISSGSAGFSTSAERESARTHAATLIQIGQHLKAGVDRIAAKGTFITAVDINDQNISGTAALFSPDGGGLVPPSTALAATPGTAWVYTWANIPGLGTSGLERVAALAVIEPVCDEINTQSSNGATPVGADLGAISNTQNFTSWPAELTGKTAGCLHNSNAVTDGYYFVQVLAVQ